MEAKDLMIEDWVYDTILQGYTRVKVLTARGIKGYIHDNIWDEKTFEPIPLTPEILEKNGFECNLNTKTFYRILSNEPKLVVEVRLWDKDTNVRIGKQCDGTFRVGYDWFINGLTITNVHELQHALRLCGIKKEITI